ncbi:MAG: ribosome-associated protein [Arenicella sp.]|jgi:ribosome-associated protein
MIKTVEDKEVATKVLVDKIVDGIQDVKGKDIVVLDLTHLQNSVTEYFIICSGESSTQVDGISGSVTRKTREDLSEKPWHTEGINNSEWVLLDYVNVVVHVFYKEVREFYNLEDLWADAERTDIPNID